VSPFNEGPPFDKLVGTCFSLLAGAVAIYVAVHLIESVAWALAIIGSVVVVGSAVIAMLRHRRHDW
jgi:hypothetical protein